MMYETCVDGTDCEYSTRKLALYDRHEEIGKMIQYYDEEIDEHCGPWSICMSVVTASR